MLQGFCTCLFFGNALGHLPNSHFHNLKLAELKEFDQTPQVSLLPQRL